MTESVTAAETAPEAEAVQGLGVTLLSALAALVLIYLLTANLQKIAAFVDRLLGGEKPPPERVEGDYKVYDIYEGEMNLRELDENTKEQDNNGKGQ